MSASNLQSATGLLRQYYGPQDQPGPPGRWDTLVKVVLWGAPTGKKPVDLDDSPLASPQETVQASVVTLADVLKSVPHGRRKAPALKLLAGWWILHFGNELESDWGGNLEVYRDELCRLRGVRVELADRILLFVGGRPTYPIDRAAIRITCRHGWLGLESEYDEWQSFFVQGLDRSIDGLREFSQWAGRVGKDFCGPAPKCDGCPLNPLLPAGGPYELDQPA